MQITKLFFLLPKTKVRLLVRADNTYFEMNVKKTME